MRHTMSPCTESVTAAAVEATRIDHERDDDHGAAAEAVRERAVEEEHQAEGEEVRREGLLDLQRCCAERGLDAGEGGQVGVDRERAEGRERGEQRGEPGARARRGDAVRHQGAVMAMSKEECYVIGAPGLSAKGRSR